MRLNRAVGTVVALALLCVGGCADDNGAVAPSAAPSPSPSPVSSTPTAVGGRAGVPDEAKRHTRAGAEAFARYYLDMVNLAWQEPRPAALAGLGTPACAFCRNGISEARHLKTSNSRYTTPPIRVGDFQPASSANADESFDVSVIQLAAKVVDDNGDVVKEYKEEPGVLQIRLQWSASQWALLSGKKVT